MTMPKRFAQAYRQAPWRIQTQRVALLLIVAVLGASILWVMLSVTVQAATAGLEIQQMEYEQEELLRQVAHLRTQYAGLTSAGRMAGRAKEMGFEPLTPENIIYVTVPGYVGRQPQIQAPPPSTHVQHPLIKPGYTQSLWEWLLESALRTSSEIRTPTGFSNAADPIDTVVRSDRQSP
jgi:cell division protein FtsL